MKQFLRSQLERRAPAVFQGIRAILYRRRCRRFFSQLQADIRQKLFPDGATIKIQSGPFKGLRYFDEIVWGSITTKWLGSYEAELQPIVEQIAARSYKTIIDVGCAEGYYAVGLTAIVPAAKVFAFDIDFISRAQVRRLAALNGVTNRLQVRALCSHAELELLSTEDTLIVCDVEGFETELLDPKKAASLFHDDILVELHEVSDVSLQVENLLRSRFEDSHDVQRIVACSRESWVEQNLPEFSSGLSRETLLKAADENRNPGQAWLWMQAKRA